LTPYTNSPFVHRTLQSIVFARTRWRHLSDAHDAIWINVMIISLPLFSPFALISTFHYKEAGYAGGVKGHHVVGSDVDHCWETMK
jgi:hypothetical protein